MQELFWVGLRSQASADAKPTGDNGLVGTKYPVPTTWPISYVPLTVSLLIPQKKGNIFDLSVILKCSLRHLLRIPDIDVLYRMCQEVVTFTVLNGQDYYYVPPDYLLPGPNPYTLWGKCAVSDSHSQRYQQLVFLAAKKMDVRVDNWNGLACVDYVGNTESLQDEVWELIHSGYQAYTDTSLLTREVLSMYARDIQEVYGMLFFIPNHRLGVTDLQQAIAAAARGQLPLFSFLTEGSREIVMPDGTKYYQSAHSEVTTEEEEREEAEEREESEQEEREEAEESEQEEEKGGPKLPGLIEIRYMEDVAKYYLTIENRNILLFAVTGKTEEQEEDLLKVVQRMWTRGDLLTPWAKNYLKVTGNISCNPVALPDEVIPNPFLLLPPTKR